MSLQLARKPILDTDYPTGDGRPMAETDLHRQLMMDLLETLTDWFASDPLTYVSGNILLFYEPGNRRRHLSPDLLVVRGIPNRQRDHYLPWVEGKMPDLVIELTSASTRDEDQEDKFYLYQDVLRIPEYILFDPRAEYLNPPFQGYRLIGTEYVPIEPVAGRLPSQTLGLHFEQVGRQLRLYDPANGRILQTLLESRETALLDTARALVAIRLAESGTQAATLAAQLAEEARIAAEARASALELELEELRRRLPGG